MADYPVGKTQSMVLEALGITGVKFFATAEQKFAELGIVVRSKRVGRGVQPEVVLLPRIGADRTDEGEGETYRQFEDFDTGPIQQWIVEK